jgi:hypothetical protein
MNTKKKPRVKSAASSVVVAVSTPRGTKVQRASETELHSLALLPNAGGQVNDHPAAVFDALTAAAKSVQRQETLRNLREACEVESRSRSPNFDYASIARRVKELKHKSPTSQTIYNNQDLKSLIAAYQFQHTPSKVNPDENVLRSIQDPHTRHEVRLLQSENEKLRRRVNILHEQYQRLEMAAIPSPRESAIRSGEPNPEEGRRRRVVAAFVRHVEQHGLYWDEATGALLQNRGGGAPREVGGPGFKQALEHLLGGT